jgi:hypothetical protein
MTLQELAQKIVDLEQLLAGYAMLNTVGVSRETLVERRIAEIEVRRKLADTQQKIQRYVDTGELPGG